MVDIGNTRLKAGLFSSENKLDNAYEFDTIGNLQSLIDSYKPNNVLISSVNNEWFAEEAKSTTFAYHTFTHQSKLPFSVKYQYNENSKVGLDRLAAISGAIHLFPNKNVLVIDCGTCITCSFINDKNEFLGGSISPSANLRFKALHTFTSQLPLYTFDKNIQLQLIGNETESSITNGVLNGIVFEMEGLINSYTNTFKELEIIFCGGDATYYHSKIKNKVRVEPKLNLYGLNNILNLNL